MRHLYLCADIFENDCNKKKKLHNSQATSRKMLIPTEYLHSKCWVRAAASLWGYGTCLHLACCVSIVRVRMRKLWPLLAVPYSQQQHVMLFTDPEMDHTHQIYSFGWISTEQPLWKWGSVGGTCWTMMQRFVFCVLFFFLFHFLQLMNFCRVEHLSACAQ